MHTRIYLFPVLLLIHAVLESAWRDLLIFNSKRINSKSEWNWELEIKTTMFSARSDRSTQRATIYHYYLHRQDTISSAPPLVRQKVREREEKLATYFLISSNPHKKRATKRAQRSRVHLSRHRYIRSCSWADLLQKLKLQFNLSVTPHGGKLKNSTTICQYTLLLNIIPNDATGAIVVVFVCCTWNNSIRTDSGQ